MTPEKCIVCENFMKLKQFEELRSQFHNWCERFQRPVALCKCTGKKIAIKYLKNNRNEIEQLDNNNAYEVLKINFNNY
ncbi:MAG: hypothetical protein ACTSPY_12965 [Candidatus Helarchaeota archaeon]